MAQGYGAADVEGDARDSSSAAAGTSDASGAGPGQKLAVALVLLAAGALAASRVSIRGSATAMPAVASAASLDAQKATTLAPSPVKPCLTTELKTCVLTSCTDLPSDWQNNPPSLGGVGDKVDGFTADSCDDLPFQRSPYWPGAHSL